MYVPPAYAETRPGILRAAIEAASFGTLVTRGAHRLHLTHLPFTVEGGESDLRLVGHVARSNPQGSDLAEGSEAVASFVLDHAYVSPSWYPSKAEHGRAVPTWNYVAVEARGEARFTTDPDALRGMVGALTGRHEGARPDPWTLTDAPGPYVRKLLAAITGVTLHVRELTGAWKLGQGKGRADHEGVTAGLRAEGALGVAALMDAARR